MNSDGAPELTFLGLTLGMSSEYLSTRYDSADRHMAAAAISHQTTADDWRGCMLRRTGDGMDDVDDSGRAPVDAVVRWRLWRFMLLLYYAGTGPARAFLYQTAAAAAGTTRHVGCPWHRRSTAKNITARANIVAYLLYNSTRQYYDSPELGGRGHRVSLLYILLHAICCINILCARPTTTYLCGVHKIWSYAIIIVVCILLLQYYCSVVH